MQMVNGTARIEHLKMIQGVINRLAGNSFSIKQWAITLTAAATATLIRLNNETALACIALIALVPFWCLDAYYLWRERLFQNCYNAVRKYREGKFMEFKIAPVTEPGRSKDRYWNAFRSKTVAPLHGALIVMVIGTAIISTFLKD